MKMGKLCYLCDRKVSKTENISIHSFPKKATVRQKWLNACGLSLNDDVSHVYICSIHFAETDITKRCIFGRSKSVIKPGAVPSMFMTNPLVIQEEVGDLSSEALTKVTTNDNFVGYEHILSEIEIKDEVCDENFNSTPMKCELFTSEGDDVNNITSAPNDNSHSTPKRQQEFFESRYISEITTHENFNSTPMKRELFTFEGDDVNNITSAPNDNSHSTPKRQRKFFVPRYISDITTSHFATPRQVNSVINLIKATDQKKSKKIKSLQDQTRKLKKRIKSLQDLVSRLKNKNMISVESGDTLMVKYIQI